MQRVWPVCGPQFCAHSVCPTQVCPPPSPCVCIFILSPSSSRLCPCTATLSTHASLPMPATSTWAGLTLCVPTCLEVNGSVHLSAHSGGQGLWGELSYSLPEQRPRLSTQVHCHLHSVPEKQKPARDDGGGGRVPRHSSTSEVRSVPHQVPPTSNTPTPISAAIAQDSICLHSQETVSG